MPRMASPYRLVSEKNRSGKAYWRVYFYLTEAKKYRKITTSIGDDGSKRCRVEAERMALAMLELGGRPLSSKKIQKTTLDDLGHNFWDWRTSPYLAARLARDPLAISPEYASSMERSYRCHAKGVLGSLPLEDITPDVLDELVTALLRKGLAPQTAKHVLYSLSPIFKWATRKRLIQYNPVPSMLEFSARVRRRRDAFTIDEAQALLAFDTIHQVWAPRAGKSRSGEIRRFHPRHSPWRGYALSLLAAVTGSRVGSILALSREDISLHKLGDTEFYIVTLKKSLGRIRGIKAGSKTDEGTEVPVAREILDRVLPNLPAQGYLFPSRGRHGVLSSNAALRSLKAAMVAIGIDEEERLARNLGFHSWRHTWVTRARAAGLSEAVRSGFTEHKDEKTAAGYTHLKAVDLLEALPVQRAFLVG